MVAKIKKKQYEPNEKEKFMNHKQLNYFKNNCINFIILYLPPLLIIHQPNLLSTNFLLTEN